jgi:hypothetical protein
MPDVATLDAKDFRWLWEAHGYGHVTPISAAARRLSIFRRHIAEGGHVHVKTHEQDAFFENVTRFDDWVFQHFPDCASLYPMPNVGTVAQMRAQIAKADAQAKA